MLPMMRAGRFGDGGVLVWGEEFRVARGNAGSDHG